MKRIDPNAFPKMLAKLAELDAVADLEWPVHVAVIFHGGGLAYFRLVDGEPPTLVSGDATPNEMHLPINVLVVDSRGAALQLSFDGGESLKVVH